MANQLSSLVKAMDRAYARSQPKDEFPTENRTKKVRPSTGLIQYRCVGGGFIPERQIYTAPIVPAGNYKVAQVDPDLPPAFLPIGTASDDLVRVPCSATDEVLAEIRKFWGLGPKYEKYGMVHKRGILLYGPPGSGKTSTIAMVSESVVSDGGIVLHMHGGPSIVERMLHGLREIEANRKLVVVMEDIDTYIENGDEEELLAFLDGENNLDNIVYVATTNYLKRLPARIRNRPSRFDRLVSIAKPDRAYRMAYLESRKLGLPPEVLGKWADDTDGLSIAHIKEVVTGVLCLDLPYDDVLTRVKSMAQEADEDTGY